MTARSSVVPERIHPSYHRQVEIDLVLTPGLGDNSYVLSEGDEAFAIDPQRDVDRLLAVAQARGARIRAVVETHVHNDYVSGAAELREVTGAEIVGPADAGYAFAFRGMREGDELELGGHRLVALASPGHTPEHTSYLLRPSDGGDPVALFSGGSLIVGSAGRTDLLGADHTDDLTRAQYRTMRRLTTLPDEVRVMPTHGAGSFCANVSPDGPPTSSIGAERLGNPALTVVDEELFIAEQLTGLPAYPSYYAAMPSINRAGPPVLGSVPVPPPRAADEISTAMERGTWLVDAREGEAFARAHVPGSLSVPLEESFASYVGWLVPFGASLALLVPDAEALIKASTQLFRIGYEHLEGWLDGGIDAWLASGRAVASYPSVPVEALAKEVRHGVAGAILDVRQTTEWDEGHLDGSRHVFIGDVPSALGGIGGDDGPTTVICASGYRSSMAASLLDRAGSPVRYVPGSGVPKLLKLLGR